MTQVYINKIFYNFIIVEFPIEFSFEWYIIRPNYNTLHFLLTNKVILSQKNNLYIGPQSPRLLLYLLSLK